MLVGTAQRTYIPMQVNSAGMIPLIFAQSMLIFPAVLSQYLANSSTSWLAQASQWVATYLINTTLWWYWAIYFVLVVAFTYFYAYVVWQQQNIPENLQKQGAHIPGYRPGETTRQASGRNTQAHHAGWRALPGHCGDLALLRDGRRQPVAQQRGAADRGRRGA